MQVAAVLTNWADHTAFAEDVYAAFVRIGLPSQAAALFTAHSALSTGWGKSVYNWNLAGLKLCAGCEDQYNWTELLGSEDPTGQAAKMPMKWRAFNTIDDGVTALWKNLEASRYDSARAMLLAGDLEYFAEVGRNGWYAASPAQMKTEMTANLQYIVKTLGLTMPATTAGGLLVGLAIAYGVYRLLSR